MLKSILNIFTPGQSKKVKVERGLSNKVILAELVEHFKEQIDNLSVGEKMLYPMSFNVLLHHEDYNAVSQSFPFVVPEVVKGIYKVIKEMKGKYPDYTPTANEWVFQFSSCQLPEVDVNDGKVHVVTKGHITTIASLMAVDIRQSNVEVSNNARVSIKLQDSNVMNNVNINWESVKNIDIIGDNYFRVKFDKTLYANEKIEFSNDAAANNRANTYAELSYSKDGKNYRFTMVDKMMKICGPDGQKGVTSIFIIDQEGIMSPHVQIRYMEESKRFQIQVFGKTRLNGVELGSSQPGLDKWFALANNSKIFINDCISVTFKVNG